MPPICSGNTSCAAAIATPSMLRVVPELRATDRVPAPEFHGCDFGMPEKADAIFCRNVIIYFDRPTQEQLFSEALPPAGARRLHVRRPLREPARYGSAAGAGGSGALQESRWPTLEAEVPEVYLQPGRVAPGAQPSDPEDASRLLRRRYVLESAAGHRRALPSDAAALPAGSAGTQRATATSISRFAIWPGNSTRWARCAARCR